MAISVTQIVNKGTTIIASGGTTTISVPSVASGSMLVFVVAYFDSDNSDYLASVADDKSNTWAMAVRANGDTDSHIEIWYAMNCAAGTTVITVTVGNGGSGDDTYLRGDAIEVAGARTTLALDDTITGGATSNAPTAAIDLLCEFGEISFAIVTHTGADTTIAGDGSYTPIGEDEDNDNGQTYNSQYFIHTTSQPDTANWTLGANRVWVSAAASFRAASHADGIGLVRGGALSNTVTNGGNPSITLPTMEENDFVLAFSGHENTAVAPGPSTAGYTQISDQSSGTYRGAVHYKKMSSSPDASVAFTGTGAAEDGEAAAVYVLRGVHQTTPIDVTSTVNTGSGNNPDPITITPVTNGAWVVVLTLGDSLDATVTVPSGYIQGLSAAANDTRDSAVHGAIKYLAAAAAEDPGAWGGMTMADWVNTTVALRPHSTAAAGTHHHFKIRRHPNFSKLVGKVG